MRRTGQKVKVRAGSYDDVRVIEELDAEHLGVFQLKYYARGAGNIRVGVRGKTAKSSETEDLVKVHQRSPKELAEARATAVQLETRGSMCPAARPLSASL